MSSHHFPDSAHPDDLKCARRQVDQDYSTASSVVPQADSGEKFLASGANHAATSLLSHLNKCSSCFVLILPQEQHWGMLWFTVGPWISFMPFPWFHFDRIHSKSQRVQDQSDTYCFTLALAGLVPHLFGQLWCTRLGWLLSQLSGLATRSKSFTGDPMASPVLTIAQRYQAFLFAPYFCLSMSTEKTCQSKWKKMFAL